MGQPHLKAPEEDETAVPVICSDYGFMGQDDGETLPMLVIKDRRSKKAAATFVEKKGEDSYAIKFFVNFLTHMAYRKIINKSDGEPSITYVKQKAADAVPGLEATPQEAPPGDHAANGEIEVMVREVKRQTRAIKFDLEARLKRKLKDQEVSHAT